MNQTELFTRILSQKNISKNWALVILKSLFPCSLIYSFKRERIQNVA